MKLIDLVKRFYGFCFYRCEFCNKPIPKEMFVCSEECEKLARYSQTFSF